jgi:hypothetical protein
MFEEDEDQSPVELSAKYFSRCANYPRDLAGVQGLAQGLKRAADSSGLPMKDICEECATSSGYCPTDRDLLAISQELKAKRAQESDEQWKRKMGRQYGNPHPFNWNALDWKKINAKWDRDAEMWARLRAECHVTGTEWPPTDVLVAALRKIGGYDDYADAWERSYSW